MSGHKPPYGGHHVDKHAKHARKAARSKMYKGLAADTRGGHKMARSRGR